ncbi:xanthine dehydrogenase family protein molybdopterin-binding subunit [Rhizobium leguminosarum]|uniref:xanthine dehydrogenase family protein molybdopterin-binding subunit n=1 Tax=Rhizobium leguminosarum TaxID=384 RepID=UPI0024B33B46|nr:xanthine dehydrogenase family protein molybdopterin-binding subunit [Rhizobium leguminosarum]WHO82648.1 xanthine dehydrogenase family protein molybdopterin-binding subunit [Rhizobium leguminosarum]
MPRHLGKETPRVDGIAKVTGKAKYAAEFQVPHLAYGFLVMSSIAKGRISAIDTQAAQAADGVVHVFTHLNAGRLGPAQSRNGRVQWAWPLQSDRVFFSNQPIALVVAETYEQARYASRLVKVTYEPEAHETDLYKALDRAEPDPRTASGQSKGSPDAAMKTASVKIEAEYRIPIEHHNPIEPHAAIAFWEGDQLTIFDKTQEVYGVQKHLAEGLGIPADNIRVISPFVGGAFGASLKPNYYPSLTAMAARELRRPVKIAFTRAQMFTGHGYRPSTFQKITLGADEDGKLEAIVHEAYHNTSSFEEFSDATTGATRHIYACAHISNPLKVARTDLATPTWMRAPGTVSGMFALESAMDELAYAVKVDPIELRLINYADVDPETGKSFSSKALRDCYQLGAEKFGWADRNPEPRSMRDGHLLVGWGMASAVWGAGQQPASARVTYRADGTASVASAASDIGPGTYTVMTMIAAEYLGLRLEQVKFELGDTHFPRAPAQGGSWTTSSVGSAVHGAALAITAKLLKLANQDPNSPLRDLEAADVEMLDGHLGQKSDPSRSVLISQVMDSAGTSEITENYDALPSPERQNYTSLAHGAQFVEVKVDPNLGTVKVARVIAVAACGKILNPLASHSQEIGGVVWGIGMALEEATEVDHRYGRIMNANLQHYHVPVNADIHSIETIFVEEEDTIVNPLGVKGMGELGMVGMSAAIANAVFHATGRRIRDLPITPDKLL